MLRVSNFSKLTISSTWGSYCRQTCLGLLMLRTYVAELENYLGCCRGSITSWLSHTLCFNCTYPLFARIQLSMEPLFAKKMTKMENAQRFGLKIYSKQWDQGYTQLLELFNALSERRL